jgi:hypothetical protein
MNTKLIVVCAVVLAIAVPASLLAGKRQHRGHGMMRDLDDEQIEKLHMLKLEHRIGNIELKAEAQKLRLELTQELLQDDPDKKRLGMLIEQIGTVKEKIQKNRIDHLLRVKTVLSDDQWKRFIRRRMTMRHGRRDRDMRKRRFMRRFSMPEGEEVEIEVEREKGI